MNHLAEAEYRFACLVWDTEPLPSGQLVKLSAAELGWKKSTTYTVLKRLCERGILQNEGGTDGLRVQKCGHEARQAAVKGLVKKEEVQCAESAAVVDKTFDGSLPRFVAAFLNSKPISAAEAAEIRALLDAAQSKEG